MDLSKEKEYLRSKLRKKRANISPELRTQKSKKITNFLYGIDEFKRSDNIDYYNRNKSSIYCIVINEPTRCNVHNKHAFQFAIVQCKLYSCIRISPNLNAVSGPWLTPAALRQEEQAISMD